ncbi:MAG: flagellar filament capping protein FliD [Anaerovibrio sp.]|uniref:flagellar filament capping protein FliD n=1 Tax=Anaerovibrio sp. TaxID=1872532 RepID=UPI001AFFC94F|nr:flagellar filament capping protein FliD [Anaerovibrio sp.]MBO5588834.1 flagellar filament capping protein FliD [Anaerovibrio sp.]MBO6245354.1 flagellar filament capping protein FliD [Anaerovibrio sp.]
MGVNGIYGLSGSGLDVESLVKMGMMSKQKQLDKLEQKQTQNTWLKEAYNGVYNDMLTMRYTTLSTYKLQSNMSAMKATSNNNAITATANGAAAAMNHTVTVSSVASNAYLLTGQSADGHNLGVARVNEDAPYSNKLSDVLFNGFTDMTPSGTDDRVYNVTFADGSGHNVHGSEVAFSINLKDSTDDDAKTYTISYTYDDLLYDDKTLNDFATEFAKSGANIVGGYDTANDSFSIYNKTGGEKNIVSLAAGDDNGALLLNNLNLGSYDVSTNKITNLDKFVIGTEQSKAGTNASVTVDGKNYNLDTNKLTVAGVTYTFTDTVEASDKATISVTQDTTTIVDNVKKFVEDYNKLLDSLNEKYSEQKYSDYKPLTESQKKAMKDEEIEKWEKKAKSGLLYHDDTVRDLMSAMREAVYTKVDAVDSEYNTLSSIGITSSNVKGHLTLDESKLNKALAADPDCVYQLFASDQDSTYIAGSTNKNKITESQRVLDYANTGVANRLTNVMAKYMDKVEGIAGMSATAEPTSYLGKLLTDMETKISSFKTLMSSYESKLYKRYDAMEVALSKLNAQFNFLSS